MTDATGAQVTDKQELPALPQFPTWIEANDVKTLRAWALQVQREAIEFGKARALTAQSAEIDRMREAGRKLEGALARISYLLGPQNEMECGDYGVVHFDENLVVDQAAAKAAEAAQLTAEVEGGLRHPRSATSTTCSPPRSRPMAKDVLSDADLLIKSLWQQYTGQWPDDFDMRAIKAILAAAEPAIRAEALEQAAKVCDDKERRKWHILTEGGALEGFGPLDCAHAIRQLGAGSQGDAS